MAVLATVPTPFGEDRELYIRLSNFEQLANHGVSAVARFRGFLSQAAFEAGSAFLFEQLVEFEADAPASPWPMAYAALKALPGFEEAVDV